MGPIRDGGETGGNDTDEMRELVKRPKDLPERLSADWSGLGDSPRGAGSKITLPKIAPGPARRIILGVS